MPPSISDLTRQFFHAIEKKDITTVIDYFSEQAELIDPHYPNSHMKGKISITEGLNWSFKHLKKFSFQIVNYFESEDKNKAAIEVISEHELMNGRKLNTPQVFIFETNNGQIIRLQAYEPYGPDGIAGITLNIIRLLRKITERN